MGDFNLNGWIRSPVSENAWGRTVLINGFNHSIEIKENENGTGRYLLQVGKYDGQHGRFDGHLRFGAADNLEVAYIKANEAVLGYASSAHEIDLTDWILSPDTNVEAYGKTVELGDRDYSLEIRVLGNNKADWYIQQGDYDGTRSADAQISAGKCTSLAGAHDAINDAIESFDPPAPHIF